MVASVPEETKRTRSTGVRATISSASSTSGSVGVPYDVPRATASATARLHLGVGVAEQHRPPGADQVDVLVAVDVGQPGAGRGADEPRGAADGVEGPHRGVHPARGHRARPLEERGARGGHGGRSGGHRPIVPERPNRPQSRASRAAPEVGRTTSAVRPAERRTGTGFTVTTCGNGRLADERLHGAANRRTVTREGLGRWTSVTRRAEGARRVRGSRSSEMSRSTARFGRGHKAMALVPLALLSAAWTASLAGDRRRHARSPTRAPTPTLPDGTSRARPRPSRPRPASPPRGGVAPGITGDAAADRRHRLHLRHPGRRARGLPARRDRHQRRRQGLPPLLAAGRRDRPGRVRPRPHQRQHPRRQGRRHARHLRPRRSTAPTAPAGSPTPTPASTTPTRRYDRAVGPMQFIPSTWSVVGVDADGDGAAQPAGHRRRGARAPRSTSAPATTTSAPTAGQRAAVYRYNHSQSYVDLVLSIMDAYLDGDFTSVPNGVTSAGYVVPQPTQPTGGDKPHHGSETATRTASTSTATAAATRRPTSRPRSRRTADQAAERPDHPDARPGPDAAAADPDAAAAAVDLDPAGRPAAHPGPGARAVPARRLRRQHPQDRRPLRPVRVRLHPLTSLRGLGSSPRFLGRVSTSRSNTGF